MASERSESSHYDWRLYPFTPGREPAFLLRAAGLSADGRFLFGYGASQALAAAVVRAAGYKTRGQGHHQTLFAALAILIAANFPAPAPPPHA